MPTDETMVDETIDDNASLPDESEDSHQELPEITDDDVKSHPLYQELEQKHSAARKGMDGSNKSKKELEAEVARLKVLAGEISEEEVEQSEQDNKYVTKEDLQKTAWELQNKDRIALVEDEYNQILEEGFEGVKVEPSVALALAEKKIDSAPVQRRRQEQMSTPSVTDRSGEPEVELTEYDRNFGLTAKKKAELERKYPHLKESI